MNQVCFHLNTSFISTVNNYSFFLSSDFPTQFSWEITLLMHFVIPLSQTDCFGFPSLSIQFFVSSLAAMPRPPEPRHDNLCYRCYNVFQEFCEEPSCQVAVCCRCMKSCRICLHIFCCEEHLRVHQCNPSDSDDTE